MAFDTDYWQQDVHYTMNVTLIPETHEIKGTSHIVYVNNSPDSLDQIYMHLYPNAFQEGSVKYREYQQNYGRLGRIGSMLKDITPYEAGISIHSFKISMGGNHFSESFEIEDTILEAVLPKSLSSDDSLVIEIEWTHHVGEQIERAGYVGDQYNAAQWYPKLVVYDENGWHNDPFHAEGEFYGEFGTFDVTLDLPEKYIVGATGVVTSGDPGWGSVEVDTSQKFDEWLKEFQNNKTEPDSSAHRVVSFHAEKVHDFAWIASPTFLYEHGSWNGIDVHVLYNESNGEKWTKVVRERSERALEWLSEKFGMYPYPQVTTTDRIKGGGMEYPMLVMNGRDSEGLILHEIGHIYFYGILANNEVDEAWLDEGFTTTQTLHYMMNRYGPHGFDLDNTDWYKDYQKKYWPMNNDLHSDQWSAIDFIRSGFDEPISRSSYLYDNGRAYRSNAYTKPSLMLTELKYILEDSVYYAAMQHYYDKWKLKHVNELRFTDAMEEFTGQELDWFFDPWLHDTQVLDYGIKDWKKNQKSDGTWLVNVDLVKYGIREMPQLLEVGFSDGSMERIWWENHQWRKNDTFTFNVDNNPISIILDPDVQTTDIDRRNNHTNGLPYKLLFRWPGMNVNHRNAFIMQWSPTVNYHDKDGFIPGFWFSRSYGPWHRADLQLHYGLDSEQVYWDLQTMRKPAHSNNNFIYNFHAFKQGGLSGLNWSLNNSWSSWNSMSLKYQTSLGFYTTNANDTDRTNLFDMGRVSMLFAKLNITKNGNSISMELATTPQDFSDWSFNRLTLTGNVNRSMKDFGFKGRFIFGVMNYGDNGSVPAQELYTINGAGAFDTYMRPYLRDQSSFYGNSTLRQHYHLTGDANLRGFYNTDLAGAESLLGTSIELIKSIPFKLANIQLALFTDIAYFPRSFNLVEIKGRRLSDAGFGFRTSKNMFGKQLYLRLDFPLVTNDSSLSREQEFQWVFSFERSI